MYSMLLSDIQYTRTYTNIEETVWHKQNRMKCSLSVRLIQPAVSLIDRMVVTTTVVLLG